MGFMSEMPVPSYGRLALSQILVRDDYRIDLFNRTVCGRLYLSEGMISRSKQEPFLRKMTLHTCAPEDILKFKAVTDREGDRNDAMNIIKNRAVKWDSVVSEIKHQISPGEDVWITWISAFFDELAERAAPIGALRRSIVSLTNTLKISIKNKNDNAALFWFPNKADMGCRARYLRCERIYRKCASD